MNNSSLAIAVFLLSHYGIMSAHLVDIHIPNGEEHLMMDNVDIDRENDRAYGILTDDDSSYEDKAQALGTLVENEEIL